MSARVIRCLTIAILSVAACCAQVSINANPALDGAAVSAPYSFNLFAAGGTPPYNFTLVSGSVPQGLTLSSTGVLGGTPSTAGAANFTAMVQDSAGASAAKSFTLNVSAAPLALSPAPGPLPSATAGQVYAQKFTATGGSGNYTYILLPTGLFDSVDLDPTSGLFFGTPSFPGTMTFSVEVIDSDHRTITQDYTWNEVPQSTLLLGEPCTLLPAATPGADYPTSQLIATGGVVPYSFFVMPSILPPELSVTSDGKLVGTGPVTALSTIQFPVTVTDGQGTSTGRVCNIPVNHPIPLTITSSSPLPPAIAGQAYVKTLIAQSTIVAGQVPPITWSLSGAPNWLTINSANGQLSGTPPIAGVINFTAQATQGSTSIQKAFSLTVAAKALTITTPPTLPDAVANRPYVQTFTASEGPIASLLWLSGSLPQGLTFVGQQIIGTPFVSGNYTFVIELIHSDGRFATQTFTLQVNQVGSTTITTASPLPVGFVGASYLQVLMATPTASSPYFWDELGALPSGVTMNSGGVVAGIPSATYNSIFTVLIDESGSKDFQLIIRAQAVTIATPSVPSGTAGVPYNASFVVIGGAGPSYGTSVTGSLPPGVAFANGTLSGTPATAGAFNFTVAAIDSDGSVGSRRYTLVVINPLSVTPPPLPAGIINTPYPPAQFTGNGGTPPYTWFVFSGTLPPGLTLGPTSGILSGTPTTLGNYQFTVRVTDAQRLTAITAPLTVVINPPPISILQSALPFGVVNSTYPQTTLTATGGTPGYSWAVIAGALPAGLSLSTGGTISGIPAAPGVSSFTIRATDSRGQFGTAQFQITVTQPLTVSPLIVPPGEVSVPFKPVQFSVNAPGTYGWSLSGGSAPPGLTLTRDGILQGTPAQEGTFSFSVAVSGANGSGSAVIAMRIYPIITIPPAAIPNCTVNGPIQNTFPVSGGSGSYSWTVSGGSPPPGVALGASGLLSGTCNTAGLYPFTATVTDSVGGVASTRITIVVTAQSVELSLASTTLQPGTVGVVYKPVTLAANGGKPPYTFTVPSGVLPSGLTLNSSGSISGTPTAAGSFSFTVQVADASGLSATGQFSIVVNPGLAIGPATFPDGLVNVPYPAVTFTATGGTKPYTWSFTGNLPSGLSLSPDGVLSGTPGQAGSFDFAVQVADTGGLAATAALTIRITAPALIISPGTLPDATAGTAYSQALAVTGGTAPYTWRIIAGAPPAGVSLSTTGVLSGIPTVAGTFNFTVQVSTPASQFFDLGASKAFSLQVNLPSVSGLAIQGLPSSSDAAQQPRFSLNLSAPYPLPISGLLSLTFMSSAVFPSDDPAVQFTSGGRRLNFTIPANETSAVFSISQAGLQTGTVAGTITITSALQTGGTDITPTPAPTRTIVVNAAPPAITSLSVVTTSSGFNIVVSGYSTPRQVTQAKFHFVPSAGSALPASDFTVDVAGAFTQWYQSTASTQFGSGFVYTQPFTLQGPSGSGSVSVTLINNQGSSQTITTQF